MNQEPLLKKRKGVKAILGLCFLINTAATFYVCYSIFLLNGIENNIRYLFMGILIVLWIGFSLGFLRSFHKKNSKYYLTAPIILIYSILLFIGGNYFSKAYQILDNMTTNGTVYSSSIVTLSQDKASTLKDVKKSTIGILEDENNIISNQMALTTIKKEKLTGEVKKYDNYVALIKALYEKEIEVAFLPTNYGILFQNFDGEDFSKIEEEFKIIHTSEKKVADKTTKTKGSSLDKPFTLLIMGVDSENESLSGSSFNGDSLMLLTFNPTTLSTTILSIPRDSYVPIMCFQNQRKNKITHAATYGEECMIDTIENFTGITIDYYVKINFKGVVNLVNALGGVEIDVPYAFCEQDSNRKFGNNTIYVEKGLQTLNGEQALAYARNRHPWPQYCSAKYSNYNSDDFLRGQHQQEVIRSLLNKLKDINNINTVYSLLETISNSVQMNMSNSQVLSLYNIAKDILAKSGNGESMDDLISIQRLYLSGSDAYIYDPVYKQTLYNFVLNKNSIAAITEAMKVNLDLANPSLEKDFYFAINEPYEEVVIGKNVKASSSIVQLPNFIGKTESQARQTANSLGIKVTFQYVKSETGKGTVTKQNYPSGTDVDSISAVVLTITEKFETTKQNESEKESTESKKNTDKTKIDEQEKIEKEENLVE